MEKDSMVYLIGAGPGNPELLSVRGKRCLEEADVVIYDYLANRALLDYASPSSERIFVGKKGFSEHVTQDEINAILVKKAQQSGVKTLVRLKGGDPFVFGRGGEEALALAAEKIAFEVVPGITAGVAAPAYAGIPVTHRGIASSVAFVTGHEDPTKDDSAINWDHLAQGVDTLCFYMGIKALPHICKKLIDAGKDPQTSVALVRWGTLPTQEVLISCLDAVVDEVARKKFEAPAIIIVGEVVSLRNKIAWFEKRRPLLGKRIVVTRSRTQASALTELLALKGADVLEFPTIEIQPPPSFEELDKALDSLNSYDWIIFTSVNGVQAAFERLSYAKKDARSFGSARVAAIGPATAEALRARGIEPDVVPTEYRAEGILNALFEQGIVSGNRVLIPRAKQAREILPETLREHGVEVEVVCAYQTVKPTSNHAEEVLTELRAQTIDLITFASSSTVNHFFELMREKCDEDELKKLLETVSFASIGPITSSTATDKGLDIDVEAKEYTISGMVEAIEHFYV